MSEVRGWDGCRLHSLGGERYRFLGVVKVQQRATFVFRRPSPGGTVF